MDYTVEKMNAFQVIGEKRTFQYDSAYGEIPKFWGEFMGSCDAKSSTSPFMTAVEKNKIGEFGICIDSPTEDKGFHYMIAGTYQGGPVPEGLELYDIPALTCVITSYSIHYTKLYDSKTTFKAIHFGSHFKS